MKKIPDEIITAIKLAKEQCGSLSELAKKTEVSHGTLSKYLNGKITSIQLSTWKQLLPHIISFLPADFKVQVEGTQYAIRKQTTTTEIWRNEEYFRLFGNELPTRPLIEKFLIEKIKTYHDDMKLLILLTDFKVIMDHLLSKYAGVSPEVEKSLNEQAIRTYEKKKDKIKE